MRVPRSIFSNAAGYEKNSSCVQQELFFMQLHQCNVFLYGNIRIKNNQVFPNNFYNNLIKILLSQKNGETKCKTYHVREKNETAAAGRYDGNEHEIVILYF